MLSKEGQKKILAERAKYHISNSLCGHLLFKIIKQKSIIYICMTGTRFCKNLSILDTYMFTANLNSKEFDKYVKLNYEGPKTFSKLCSGIMAKIFKGFCVVSDKQFQRHTATKRMSTMKERV